MLSWYAVKCETKSGHVRHVMVLEKDAKHAEDQDCTVQNVVDPASAIVMMEIARNVMAREKRYVIIAGVLLNALFAKALDGQLNLNISAQHVAGLEIVQIGNVLKDM